jgi:hypothetical protein
MWIRSICIEMAARDQQRGAPPMLIIETERE